MLIIAHRGNLAGPGLELENSPQYVQRALDARLDVEMDVWRIGSQWFSGHDRPKYRLERSFLDQRGLWIHCKNKEALSILSDCAKINCFWHQEDAYTLTSQQYIWTFPGMKLPNNNGVAVMPETMDNWNISRAIGICTDFPLRYRG